MTDTLLNTLRQTLGDDAVLTPCASDPLDRHLVDWRKRYQGRALAVVRPANTEGVSAAVKLCAQHGVSIVPQGGNTSLVGGSVPDASGRQIVLSLSRLNRVLSIDPSNLSMTVQAGCTLAQVQEAADQAGLLFPLSLASEGSCTIGGNLATNAGGTQVLRHGTARALCLGLQAVTAQGDVWDGLKALRKDNTGYDLRDLLIGSEGTLGIITAATLALSPRPASQIAALASCATLPDCLSLLQAARQSLGAALSGFELMHSLPVSLTLRHLPDQAKAIHALMAPAPDVNTNTESATAPAQSPHDIPTWTILMDASSSQAHSALSAQVEELLQHAMEQGWVRSASLAHNQAQYRQMWALRESLPLAEKIEGLMVKHDIAVPTSAIPAFVQSAELALQMAFPDCRIVCFGHLGDGNLHYNVQGPPSVTDLDFMAEHEHAVNAVVYDIALSLGGTLSAEHGIGQLKREELGRRQTPVGTAWMRAIKQALDPSDTLNPGRLVP